MGLTLQVSTMKYLYATVTFLASLSMAQDSVLQGKKAALAVLELSLENQQLVKRARLNSPEAWEHFKDTLEDSDNWFGRKMIGHKKRVPEKEVDALEVCVSSCKRKDYWKDFFFVPGKSHEELEESAPDRNNLPVACPDCIAKIPKSVRNQDWNNPDFQVAGPLARFLGKIADKISGYENTIKNGVNS